jgi:alpha-galactosidase
MPISTVKAYTLGDLHLRFVAPADAPDKPGLQLVPSALAKKIVTPREHLDEPFVTCLPDRWLPVRAWEVEPLIRCTLRSDDLPFAFAAGRTLHVGAGATWKMLDQQVARSGTLTTITSSLSRDGGLTATHSVLHAKGDRAVRLRTRLTNGSTQPVTVDLASSFTLGGITPFAERPDAGRLVIHRLRSCWSSEALLESRTLESLNLERSWTGHGVRAERFGQVGSMPCNGWMPFVAAEDTVAGVTWAARLTSLGSWQLELYRRGDQLALSGGLADREFGHWSKTLQPGESLDLPEALLTAVVGNLDDAADALNATLQRHAPAGPASEKSFPVIFNEWCTSWGNPTHDNLIALADRLKGSGVKYIVIDDGWAERPPEALIQSNGDWRVNRTAFPGGLRATTDALRARGFIPGIWFEFEVVNPGAEAWNETTHQIHRDGRPLQIGTRRFWDFRDPWVHDYLMEKVAARLRADGFSYLKVDYNDSIGLGADGADSLGEGLRQHLEGVRAFFQRLRRELPDLVIENCSSGGHREEPGMIALTAMSSFSDAHETPDIPLIAADLQRVLPAPRNQIWAVLRHTDSLDRIAYSMAATFLGRMCLSGDAHQINAKQWALVRTAIALQRAHAAGLARAVFRTTRTIGVSRTQPEGVQAVVRHVPGSKKALVIWHGFKNASAPLAVTLPPGRWRVADQFGSRRARASVKRGILTLRPPADWTGGVLELAC